MKRVFVSLAVFSAMLLCLCGCGEKTAVNPIIDGFTAQTTIQYKEMEVQGQFSCGADGRVNMAFSSPKTLEGVTLGWTGSEMQMGLGGMTIAVSEDSMPDGGLIRCLTQVLVSIDPKAGEWDGSDYVIRGEAAGKAYTLLCDAQTGLPKSLTVPDEDLTATFTEVTAL